MQLLGDLREVRLAHGQRAQVRQLPLVAIRVTLVEDIRHDVLQHRVPQKFQALVILWPHRRMRQRPPEQRRILELIPQCRQKLLHHADTPIFSNDTQPPPSSEEAARAIIRG